jgi:hypothetical protein
MDVTGRVENDRLSFSCPQCDSTFSWQTERMQLAPASVSALCEDCGRSFSVRNPYAVLAATSPLVGASTQSPIIASPATAAASGAQQAVLTITTPAARKFSIGSFVVALVAFLLPFSTLTCQGQKFHSFSGVQLVKGGQIESKDFFGGKQVQKFPPEPLAIFAFLAAIAGLVITVSGKSESAQAGIAAAAGAGLLLWLKTKIESDVMKQGQGMVGVEFGFGFWLALLALAVGAAVNFGILQKIGALSPTDTTNVTNHGP